jgi:NADH-quinone oxidoreductase subunit L
MILLVPLWAAAFIALFLRRRGGIAATLSVLAATFVAVRAVHLAVSGVRFEGGWEWLRCS